MHTYIQQNTHRYNTLLVAAGKERDFHDKWKQEFLSAAQNEKSEQQGRITASFAEIKTLKALVELLESEVEEKEQEVASLEVEMDILRKASTLCEHGCSGERGTLRSDADSSDSPATHGGDTRGESAAKSKGSTSQAHHHEKRQETANQTDAVDGGSVSGSAAKKTPSRAHEAAVHDVSSIEDNVHAAHGDADIVSKLEAKLEEYEDRIMEMEEVCSACVCVCVS
jgi:hypothetical protein